MTNGYIIDIDPTAIGSSNRIIHHEDFFASTVATIAAGESSAASSEIGTIVPDAVRIVAKLKGGNAAADDRIDFRFASIGYYGESYPSNSDFTISVDMSGTTAISQAFIIDTRPYYALKILGVDNTSASYSVTNVNATLSYYFGPGGSD